MKQKIQLTLAVLVVLAAGRATATTYNVDRFDDSTTNGCSQLSFDDCALRGAIIAANNHPGDDIVRLHTGTYTLSIGGVYEDLCQTGDLDVRDNLLILGDGPDMTVIDAAGVDRVLDVRTGDHLTVRGVTITGGDLPSPSGGAGIMVEDGSLRLESCVVAGNGSSTTGYGGAVYDLAFNFDEGVQIVDTWITANSAANCSAIYTVSNFRLERSTVSGNHSTSNGPAIQMRGQQSLLYESTISDNTSDTAAGGGVWTDSASCIIGGCTIAGNQGAEITQFGSPVAILYGSLIEGTCAGEAVNSSGGNLESPGNTCNMDINDLVNVTDPMLSDLGWFGGPTPVRRPQPGSPAVDEPLVGSACSIADQRGLSRPRDGGGDPASDCDIGSVELAGAGEIFVEGFECGFLTPWSDVVR